MRFTSGPRSFLNFIRKRFFGSVADGVLTFLGACGIAGAYVTATDLVDRQLKKYAANQDLLIYIAATYLITLALFVGWVLLYRKVRIVLARTEQERDYIAKVQHCMAEIVRSAAIAPPGGGLVELEKLPGVIRLLEGDLARYLESKLGRNDITTSVKYAVGDEGRAPLKLRALFRRIANQSEHSRKAEMPLTESVVYERFKNADRSVRRIVVCDTRKLKTDAAMGEDQVRLNEAYRKYAKLCGFRSVLAFPLRAPTTSREALTINPIQGFISFDCPEPNAFEPLFDVPMFSEVDTFGMHYGDTEELNFFYGLADSLATLALLFDESGAIVQRPISPGGGNY